MNFNIIEGQDDKEILDDFINLYYDESLTKADICKKLDISGSKYSRIRKELIEDGKIDKDFRNRMLKAKAKYYCFDKKSGRYNISRALKGKHVFFIAVPTEEQAKFCVNLFHRYGWKKVNIPFVRARLIEEFAQ